MADQHKLHVAIIIQARLGSVRLPGKVLMSVLGRPLLSFLLERLHHCRKADIILVATSANPVDSTIIGFCEDQKIPVFVGSEQDVLDRYYLAAKSLGADAIVRITGDCPLIDPAIVDQVIDTFVSNYPKFDYVSNVVERAYARGMDVEVFSVSCLERLHNLAKTPEEREHVTLHVLHNPHLYSIGQVTAPIDTSRYRLTVDTPEDFRLIKLILEELYPKNPGFTLQDVVALLERHPDWVKINAHVPQKSITKDENV